MRKNLLVVLALAIGASAFAQNRLPQGVKRTPVNPDRLKNMVPVKVKDVDNQSVIPANRTATRPLSTKSGNPNSVSSVTDAFVGQTFYDLQTNESISNRLLRHSDGTISAVWTTSCGTQGTDRGTGYNYWDGSTWINPSTQCARVEGVRTGFINIAVTTSGHEMSFGHSSTQLALNLSYRGTKGTGAWTDQVILGTAPNNDTWAKGIAGGANGESVHIIAQGTGTTGVPLNGQDGPLYYYRSTDGGVTFPIVQQTFPALDATDNAGFGGDDYSIDANGDVIAIVVGDFATNLNLMKSTDNGNTWNKTIIFQSPLPQPWADTSVYPDLNGDTFPDTLELPSGDAHVMLDNNNNAHVWWSTWLCVNDDPTAPATGYFPNGLDGLYYWHEGMAANSGVVIAAAYDENQNGFLDIASGVNNGVATGGNGMGNYRGSITQMPSSGIDGSGALYLAYQSMKESADTATYNNNHKHIFVIKSVDGGMTWTPPANAYDILQDADSLINEGVFACMAKFVDNDVCVLYQRDVAPGTSLSANTTEAGFNAGFPSDMVLGRFPATDIFTGVSDQQPEVSFTIGQNVPNPANDYTDINFNLKKSSTVSLDVMDVLGRNVYSEEASSLPRGNHKITLNTASMNAGVYFYTISINGEKVSRKMIVE